MRGVDIYNLYFRCAWKGRHCSAANFTTVFTNYGACYKFNGDNTNPLTTQSAGKKYYPMIMGIMTSERDRDMSET